MNVLKAMLLGIIQGFSEFMPISSSGNLYFFSNLFNIEAYTLSFDIIVHTASLLALIFVYFRELTGMLRMPVTKKLKFVGAGVLPVFVMSVLFQSKIDGFFIGSKAIGLCYIFSGAVLFYETMYRPGKKTFKQMKLKDAFIIGGFQTVGIIPAVSRTGLALAGGLQRGFDGKTSIRFAYLMAVPAMIGRIFSNLIQTYQSSGDTVTDVFGFFPTVFGFIASFIASVVAIRLMQMIASKGKFRAFAYYMWAIGIIVLADMLFINKIF